MTTKEINGRQFTSWHLQFLKFLRKLITDGNVWLLRVTGGRIGNSFLGVPVLLMTTVAGNQARTTPNRCIILMMVNRCCWWLQTPGLNAIRPGC